MWDSGDYSHGWVGTPLIQMSARILGVIPQTPGFQSALIRPLPFGLGWASGSVPSPYGPFHVAWTNSASTFSIQVTVPKRTLADLVLPGSGAVLLDGKRTERDGKGAVAVAPGTHKLYADH
jgi:alpha-L-rhamnosidase